MLFAVIVVAALLIYFVKLKYYTLRGPLPGLSPHFLFGNLIQSGILGRGVVLPHALLAFKARFGDIFQFWLGPTRVIFVSGICDVEHIFTNRHIYDQSDLFVQTFGLISPDGLISIKGSKYKRHASVVLPLFRRGKIISNFDLIIDNADKLLARWRRVDSAQHIHCDIIQQCEQLTLSIFGSIAFDYNLETLDNDDATDNELTQALRNILSTFYMTLYSPSIMAVLYLKLSLQYRRSKAIIERYLYRMIEQELNESAESIAQRKRTCLIASLVASLQKNEMMELTKSEEDKQGLSRKEVLDEMLLFLTAGYETIATVLAWFIHLMSKHPRVQQKIKIEIMNNGANKQELLLDRLDSFVYLDCVLNEVLRFAPLSVGTGRTLAVDDRLPEGGAQLYKGDQVFIPFQSLARDTRLWSIDPELFYPERFLDEDKNHHPYAFIPFGSGHRQCIGKALALFELKTIIARLMQYVTFVDGGSQVNAGGYFARVAIMPKHVGVRIEFD